MPSSIRPRPRSTATAPPCRRSPPPQAPELLRNSLACLLLATGFAAFARRAGVELTLLEEGEEWLWRLRRRPGRGRDRSNADYIREMAGDGGERGEPGLGTTVRHD
jgi:hypothetical protein